MADLAREWVHEISSVSSLSVSTLGSRLTSALGRLLGRTPEETAYGGKILGVGTGAAVGDIPECIGLGRRQFDIGAPRDLLRGFGGVSAVSLSTATTYGLYGAGATAGSATAGIALPIALAGYGGYEMGSVLSSFYERLRGNSLGSELYDLVHHGRLFNHQQSKPDCKR